MQRVGLSCSSSVLCSKCVYLKHRKCRVETLGLQREALKATGFSSSGSRPRRWHLAGWVQETQIEAGAARQGEGLVTQCQAEPEHPEGRVPLTYDWDVTLGLMFL